MNSVAPFRYTVAVRSGYVFVWQSGLATVAEELRQLQREVEAALAEAGTRNVLFDNRETQAPDEWIRAMMWTWLSSTPLIRRVAMVQGTVRAQRRANRTAELNRVLVQAFMDYDEAVGWLCRDAGTVCE